MRAYTYRVRVLSAIDVCCNQSDSNNSIPLQSIESAFERICRYNKIKIPTSWRKRLSLVLNLLVEDGWLLSTREGCPSYTPSPQLRTIIAKEKLAHKVPPKNGELKTFAAISESLDMAKANDTRSKSRQSGRHDSITLNPIPQHLSPAHSAQRKSARFDLTLKERQLEAPRRATPAIVVRTKKSRQSDPGPRLVDGTPPTSSPHRSSSGDGGNRAGSSAQLPKRERKPANRRHTLSIPQQQSCSRISLPSGVAEEIQFTSLKQALSHRTRRSLRRNALSEEMNNIETEKKVSRKRNEELMLLREKVARLELRLQAMRGVSSQEGEQFETGEQEPDGEGMDPDDNMRMDFDMHAQDNYADKNPKRSTEPEQVDGGSQSESQRLSNGTGRQAPAFKPDQKKITELEEEIALLKLHIEARGLVEDNDVFHDAEEQIMLEENMALAQRLEDLRNEPLRHIAVTEETVVEKVVETETIKSDISLWEDDDYALLEEQSDGESIDDADMPFPSSGVDSGIVTSSMPMQIDEAEAGFHSRIAYLQTENEKLQQLIESLNKKLHDLEEDNHGAISISEENRQKAEILRRENQDLRILGDKFAARIIELEELEGNRLENVAFGAVQTEPIVNHEKEALMVTINSLQDEIDDLLGLNAAITEEKRQIESVISESQAAIRGLENAVQAGIKEREETESFMTALRVRVNELASALSEDEQIKRELEVETDQLRNERSALVEEMESLRLENNNLEVKLLSKEELIEELNSQLKQICSRVLGFEENINDLRDKLRDACEELLKRDQTIEDLEADKSDLKIRLEQRIEELKVANESRERETSELASQIEELNGRQEKLQSEVIRKGDQLKEALRSKAMALESSAEMEEAITRIESEKESLEEEHSRLAGDVQELLDKISVLEDELEDATEDLSALEKTNESLESQLADSEERIQDLEQENQSLVQNADEFKKVASNLEIRNCSLSEKLNDVERMAADFEEQKVSLEGNFVELNRKVADLNANNFNLNGQLAQRTGEKTVLEKKLLESEGNYEALKAVYGLLQTDKQSLDNEIIRMEKSSEILQNQNTILNNKIISLEEEITKLNADIFSSEEVKRQLQNNISNLQKQIEILDETVEISKREKASAARDIASLQMRVTEIEAELQNSESGNLSLRNELLESKAQIETFKQTVSAYLQEEDRMNVQIAELTAELLALRKAVKVSEQQISNHEDTTSRLVEEISALKERTNAMETERTLLRQDISDLTSQNGKLTQLLEISEKENVNLYKNIEDLQEKVGSLEFALGSANSANANKADELNKLKDRISDLKKEAQAVDEERVIILEKIRPYIAGEEPLDMAIEQVLTALVVAREELKENQSLKLQLENKIRILGHDVESSPEDIVERLTDRFREVRKRVEDLYNQRRDEKDSHFTAHRLEEFSWIGSNDHALQVIETLVDELDEKLTSAKESAKALQSSLDLERETSSTLNGYLSHVVSALDGPITLRKNEIPSFVERHVLALENRIEDLDDKLAELEDITRERDAKIQALQHSLDEAEAQKDAVSTQLSEATIAQETTSNELAEAHQEIIKLNTAIDTDRMDIDELERTIEEYEDIEEDLRQQLLEQSATQDREVERLEREKIVAVAAANNKLAAAIDEKNHLESRIADIIAEFSSRIHKMESESQQEVENRDSIIATLRQQYQAYLEESQSRIDEANQRIDMLTKESQEEKDKHATVMVDSEARIKSMKATLSEKNFEAENMHNILQQREADIEALKIQISQLRSDGLSERKERETKILALENEISDTRFEARKEKVRLEHIIQDREAQVEELKTRTIELEKLLEDADAAEADLDDRLKRSEANHQLSIEEAAKEKTVLLAQVSEVQRQLQTTRAEMAEIQNQLVSDNAALRTLVDDKKRQIESLRSSLSTMAAENKVFEEKILILELEKRDLETDLELEREKGRDVLDNLQKEAQKFMNRIGDSKGQYIREQKLRESKKRTHVQMTADPGSMSEPIIAVEASKRTSVKKRRVYGDSGIGIEADEDEGFEGSVSMGSHKASAI